MEEIKQDLVDTQREINNYREELEILMRNPQENKVRMYLLKGRINQREVFIKILNKILSKRKKK